MRFIKPLLTVIVIGFSASAFAATGTATLYAFSKAEFLKIVKHDWCFPTATSIKGPPTSWSYIDQKCQGTWIKPNECGNVTFNIPTMDDMAYSDAFFVTVPTSAGNYQTAAGTYNKFPYMPVLKETVNFLYLAYDKSNKFLGKVTVQWHAQNYGSAGYSQAGLLHMKCEPAS